ncbi:MAG: hypothetical protein ABFS16_15850 [Bacteroidota bacterium]
MKKFKNTRLFYFILGMLVMLVLDMVFHFNNSVEKKIDREINKVQNKIDNILN